EGRLDDNLGKLAESLRREIDSRKAVTPAFTPFKQTKSTPNAIPVDEQTIAQIATRFAENFVTAIERRLSNNQLNKPISDELNQELCIKCRKKIEQHLKLKEKRNRNESKDIRSTASDTQSDSS
ncbi:MAG: hypothetical protein QME64_04345, partial [bacterium]|nr:hypothetical protein [bacterium]